MSSCLIIAATATISSPCIVRWITFPIDCSIGIDFERVTYGNVGSTDRLDFKVIGRPAIIAARLSDLAKTEGHAILATADIAAVTDDRLLPMGSRSLHNISEPVETFAMEQS